VFNHKRGKEFAKSLFRGKRKGKKRIFPLLLTAKFEKKVGKEEMSLEKERDSLAEAQKRKIER